MDNVNNNSSAGTRPIWERQKSGQRHKSAVERALKAHRQRTSERKSRTQERLNLVRGLSNQFFTPPQVSKDPQVFEEPIQAAPVVQESSPLFNPREIDNLLDEAQFASTTDTATILVNKEISNPEEGPVDDVPKGSFVDYQV